MTVYFLFVSHILGKVLLYYKFQRNQYIILINQFYVYYYVHSNLCLLSYFLSMYYNVILATIKKDKRERLNYILDK